MFPAGPPPPSSGPKCFPRDLHRKLRIRVFPAGPQQQPIKVFPAGPQQQPIKVFPAGPQPRRIYKDIPDRMPDADRMSENMWDQM